jgi:spore maturation protein A
MLNYIWAGFIIFSLIFALTKDFTDLSRDTYRNGDPLPVTLSFPNDYQPEAGRQTVLVAIDADTFRQFYHSTAAPESAFDAVLVRGDDGREVRFSSAADLPEPLSVIRDFTNKRTNELQGSVGSFEIRSDSVGTTVTTTLTFGDVRFIKLNAISQAALDFAEVGVEIALSLIGVMALFLGLLKVAEASGVVASLARFMQPLLRPLFPDIPEDHPAMAMIVLNLAANVFGLANAATPFGIKAMEELQKLNPSEDTATDPMIMLLAMNTASVQLVPPVLLLALIGLQINQLIFAIIIATGISLTVAITLARLFGRMERFRKTNPNLIQP